MAINWGTIKSLLLFFGPLLLPKAITWYRNTRNAARAHNLTIQPIPANVSHVLNLLFVAAAALLILTLPALSPENIFTTTNSRLQIPVDVLFNRLASVRPNNTLSPRDDALRAKFASLESRLLYLQFGPAVLADCPFCASDDPRTYFYYALGDHLLVPHLLNLVLVAVATSSLVAGRAGASWRTLATMAAVLIAGVDLWVVNSYNHQSNSRAMRPDDLEMFFWTARTARFLALAGLDAVLGWVLYLTSTNRAFVVPPSAAERVEGAVKMLGATKARIHAVGIVKNTVMRDEELRGRGTAFWADDVRRVGGAMEEREVIESVNDALENRIDIRTVSKEADMFAENLVRTGLGASGQVR